MKKPRRSSATVRAARARIAALRLAPSPFPLPFKPLPPGYDLARANRESADALAALGFVIKPLFPSA